MTRLQLIAHETAHLWFGDMVTMRWFDDVWTKEVFANVMASKIAREQFPLINHDLNFLKSYYPRAMSTDRTLGTHPIQQPLDNLNRAGLLYGNIIYEKAPIMMDKLEQQMGPDAFREGLRRYLKNFAYANATWNDLVAIFDSVAPKAHVRRFSDVWVREKGAPVISCHLHGDTLTVRQSDPFHRSLFWPQRVTYGLLCGDSLFPVTVDFNRSEVHVKVPCHPETIIPNIDGQGYGRFVINDSDRQGCEAWMTRHIHDDNTAAYSVLLTLYDNFLLHAELRGVHRRHGRVLPTLVQSTDAMPGPADGIHALPRPLLPTSPDDRQAATRQHGGQTLRTLCLSSSQSRQTTADAHYGQRSHIKSDY